MDTTSPQSKPFPIMKAFGFTVALITLVVVSYLAKSYLDNQQPSVTVIETKSCQPEVKDCSIQIGNDSIQLDFDTGEFELKSGQLMMAVVTSSLSTQPSQISLQGRDMYMGENHYSLSPTSNDTFSNELQFPACTTGRMVWQATITYEDGKAVVFEFEAE